MARLAQRKKIAGGAEKFFENSFVAGWFFKVGDVFSRALDFSSTLNSASIGTCYSFETGDIFYDNSLAYTLPWQETKRTAKFCVRVLEATPSSIIIEEKQDEFGAVSKIKKIADGALTFELIDFSDEVNPPKKITTDQFKFVEFLKSGNLEVL